MDADKMSATLSKIHRIFTGTYPYYIYDLNFLDDRIESFYHTELIISQLFKVFAFLTIFISCLGLYGLISFMAVQRNKEIGIRKVLGASVGQLVFLLSKEFTLLVLVAFAVATPLSWYFMHQWLQKYTYRISLGPGFFIVTVLAAVAIAWMTVGYRALRAALANPAQSLGTE